MKNPFQYVVTLIAAIPGLATVFGQIKLPDEHQWLINILTTVVPPLFVLMVMMFWKDIKKTPRTYLLVYGLLGVCLFLTFAIAFLFAHAEVVIVASSSAKGYSNKPVLFPFSLTGEFSRDIAKAGSRQAFVDEYGPDTASEQIARMSNGNRDKSVALVILALLLGGFATFLAITFAIFWFYFTKQSEDDKTVNEVETVEPNFDLNTSPTTTPESQPQPKIPPSNKSGIDGSL